MVKNFRGIPTAMCPNCDSIELKISVIFDPKDYEIGMYSLDAECTHCGALLTAPTPIDMMESSE